MKYYNYPQDKTEIFSESDRNYFFKGDLFSYLCTFEQAKCVDQRSAFSGNVLVLYKRYAVIKNGRILRKNEAFYDGHIPNGRYGENGFVIISDKEQEYLIQSWGKNLKSFELRDDSGYNTALRPVIFQNGESAIKKALDISEKSEQTLVVAQWFSDFDRH